METLVRDLRYVTRSLFRSPGFFAVTVLTLALGIGATTAIFSVIAGVLLRPLPYPDADRIVRVWQIGANGGRNNVSDPNFEDWRSASRSFAALAEVRDGGVVSVSGAGEPARVQAAAVSRDFLSALGIRPVRGRAWAPEEQRVGGAPAILVSHGYWQRYLGARPSLEGTTLTFDGRVYSVIGVMPPEVDYPVGAELWVPRELEPRTPSRTAHNWEVIGRLEAGVTLAGAQREMSAISRQLKGRYGDDTWMSDAELVPLREQMVGRTRAALLVLVAASAFLLLIACANVVNLLVARTAARQGELAVRLALGAGRWWLARQFLAEALVLALVGGALGVVLAALGVRALVGLDAGDAGTLPRMAEVRLDWSVLLFAFGVSLGTAVVLGLLTALRGTRGDLRGAMAESQRTQAGAGSSYRIRSTLVVAQVALTLVLLVGAGLLGRSFMRLVSVNPGYRTERAIVLDLSVPEAQGSADMARRVRLYDELMARVRGIPGVTGVGGANAFPLAGGNLGNGTFLVMTGRDEKINPADFERIMQDATRTGQAEFRVASGEYFRVMNIPLVRGRLFEERDAPDAPHVAVISAALAKERWPGDDPLGKTIQFGNMDGDLRPFTIVGVVGDVREASLASEPRPTFYASYRQRPVRTGTFNIVIGSAGDPAPVIAAARAVVRELAPDVPPRFRTLETVVADSVADRRFMLLLVGVFGGAALLLATLGVYSVISFLVTQRRKEIGLRVALGAHTSDVLRLVLRQGASLALIGIAVGAAVALAGSRLLARFLYGVSTTDPVSFVAVSALLAGVVLRASYVPARRAARVDPMSVLRGE
ncbi:MAG: ABC transporter permease [Gemmatimonadaceae bacterium]